MSPRWPLVLLVYLGVSVAPGQLRGQTAAPAPSAPISPAAASPTIPHHTKLRTRYDKVADSTHLFVVTHKGKYFLTIQRPRLTWIASYAGRQPSAPPPAVVVLEFRTQTPQVALNSQLVIASNAGARVVVASAGAYSDPGVQTWSHFMRFPIPIEALAEVLASTEVTITVGEITARCTPDHVYALRDLLNRVGARPPAQSPGQLDAPS